MGYRFWGVKLKREDATALPAEGAEAGNTAIASAGGAPTRHLFFPGFAFTSRGASRIAVPLHLSFLPQLP